MCGLPRIRKDGKYFFSFYPSSQGNPRKPFPDIFMNPACAFHTAQGGKFISGLGLGPGSLTWGIAESANSGRRNVSSHQFWTHSSVC